MHAFRWLSVVAILGPALLNTGCSTTLVQQLPAGEITTCDPAWPGVWKATSNDSDKPEYAWVEVSADCKSLTFTDDKKTSVEGKTLTLVSTVAGDFLSITDADGEPECIGKDLKDCGFPIERFEKRDNQIRLYAANHRLIHDAIAAGVVTGLTQTGNEDASEKQADKQTAGKPRKNPSVSAESMFQNLITGTPEQIGQWFVEHPDYFETQPWLVLDRETTDTRPKHPEVSK